jgi:hypothetical protein
MTFSPASVGFGVAAMNQALFDQAMAANLL